MNRNWEEEIFFLGINRGREQRIPNREYSIRQRNNELEFSYPDFSIQYINNEKGLRQNFIINERLAGKANLELLLKHKGALAATIINNSIEFSKQGFTRLFYEDLKVWDAQIKNYCRQSLS